MNIVSFPTYDALSAEVADQLFHSINHELLLNDHFVLGLATGTSPKGVYEILIRRLGQENIDLTNFYTFNLDEYVGVKKTHPKSYHREMMSIFWKPLQAANSTFHLEHTHILDSESQNIEKECKEYEAHIKSLGGIDLQILGLGVNGHIAFNEPGSAGDSRTRKIQIDESTIEANSRFFNGDEDKVPTEALTMGIGTILESKEIFLLVHGEGKREVFEKLEKLTEPTPDIPASYLLNHPKVTVFSDL